MILCEFTHEEGTVGASALIKPKGQCNKGKDIGDKKDERY